MKLINREYGFQGRPPYFKDYKQQSDVAENALSGVLYPKKFTLGYGLDIKNPTALFVQGFYGAMWGVKIEIKQKGKWVNFGKIDRTKPNSYYISEGARFVKVEGAVGHLKTAVVQENGATMLFTAKKKCEMRFALCPLGSAVSALQSEHFVVRGRAFSRGVIPGEIELTDNTAEIRNRYTVVEDSGEIKEYLTFKPYTQPKNEELKTNYARYEYTLQPGEKLAAYLVIGDKLSALEILEEQTALRLLAEQEAKELQTDAPTATDAGDVLFRARQLIRSHLAYDPYLMSKVLTETSAGADGYFGFRPEQRALGAMIAALAGEEDAAETMAQTSATDPMLGAIAALTVFRHTKNKVFLQSVLPRMMEVWELTDKPVVADVNTLRELYFRQENSPLKEDALRRGAIYSLDMSCYKLLSFRIICQLLAELGVDSSDYRERADGLEKNINGVLYNPEQGLYCNRYTSGEWCVGYGYTSFLPMAAGAVKDGKRLNDLLMLLYNPERFWGDAMLPTIAKDSVYYGKRLYLKNGEKQNPYENFTGMISPVANFTVYAGLKSVGAGEMCEAVARSSYKLFQTYFEKFGEYPSFYRPDGKRSTAEDKFSLSALMLPLLRRSELIDYDYVAEGAVRFCSSSDAEAAVKNVRLNGKSFAVKKDAASFSVFAEGEEVLRGEPAGFEIRGFLEEGGVLSFLFRSEKNVRLALKTPWFTEGLSRKIVFHVEAGKSRVVIKDDKVEVTQISV